MKVLRPTKNKQTQGYSSKHPAYDHDDIPDPNCVASFYGKIIQSKNSETKNWRSYGKLTTNDYGNYLINKGEVDGKTVYQLGAHFKPGTVLPKGTEVKPGQVIAQAGKTGNIRAMHGGDGSHSHWEYRNSDKKNIKVTFTNKIEVKMEQLPKDSIIRDIYSALKKDYSPDEVERWLQENKNILEIIDSIMRGDDAVKERWSRIWGVSEQPETPNENFKTVVDDVKLIANPLGATQGMDSAELKTMLSNAVTELVKLREKEMPKPEIIVAEKELHYFGFMGLIFGMYKKEGK